MKLKTFVFVAIFSLLACKTKDESFVRPPVVYGMNEVGGRGETQKYDPMVDIYFIIDDSQSMEPHQDDLRANISQFISGFAQSKIINFHIGVAQIWDTERYSEIPPVCPDGHRNYEAVGALLPLKGSPEQLKIFGGSRYVSRAEGYEKVFQQVLQQTLDVTPQDLVKTTDPNVCQKGPETEEIFPVILHSFEATQNAGFWRKGSFKVFVILSDAIEGSNYKAKEIDTFLRAQLGIAQGEKQDKYRVYSVVMKPDERVKANCKADPGFHLKVGEKIPNHELATLSQLSNNGSDSGILDICGKYGAKLLAFGQEIKKATLKAVHISIPTALNFNDTTLKENKRLQVKLGGEVLKRGTFRLDPKTGAETIVGGDWDYRQNLKTNLREVIVRGDLANWEKDPNAQIEVEYAPIINGPGAPVKSNNN